MSFEQDRDELSPEEKARFAALPRKHPPTSLLEERIIGALKVKGLIRLTPSLRIWTLPKLAGAFAAAAVLIALGFGAGKWQSRSSMQTSTQPMFIMLLYEAKGASRHEVDRVVEYTAWARTIARSNHMLGGAKLQYDGKLMRSIAGGRDVRDISTHGGNEQIAGYFLIQAADYSEAEKIAASCPHLKYGGLIELRQIDQS